MNPPQHRGADTTPTNGRPYFRAASAIKALQLLARVRCRDSRLLGHHPNKQMSKINNLKEFLAWRGFGEDEVRYWARCFYKYTDCGPWVVFLMRGEDPGEEAKDEEFSFTVSIGDDGKLQAESEALPPDDLLSLFGFNQEGRLKKSYRRDSCMRSMQAFWEAVKDFRDRLDATDRFKITSIIRPRSWRTPGSKRWVRIYLTRHVSARPPSLEEIYYEDIGPKYAWKEVKCCCASNVIPDPRDPQEDFYIPKDPDPECEDCGGSGKVKRWMQTREEVKVDPELCVGIKFGSIVEGSDAYSGPFEHFFPFDTEDFESDEEYMEKETSFYWERDNSQWYEVVVNGNNYYQLHYTWGEITWDSSPPYKRLKDKVEHYIEENWGTIPTTPGLWGNPKPGWVPAKIPGTRAEIYETYNDEVF